MYLGLGANEGDRRGNFLRALEGLAACGVRVRACSSLYATAPVGGPAGQGPYLNAVVLVTTRLAPRELLACCQELENRAGRVRAERWGPRPLDLDILLWGERRVQEEDLVIPHPRLLERRFVLEPLLELDPDLVLPGTGLPLRGFLPRVSHQTVHRLEGPPWCAR